MLDPSREYINPVFRHLLNRRRTPSAAFRLFFHLVFSTRFRFRALRGGAEGRFLEILLDVAQEQGVHILAVSINEEHVHLLLSLQPHHAISEVVKSIKGRSSRLLRQEYPTLQPESHLWTSGYYVDSLGEKSVPQILAYIQTQRESGTGRLKSALGGRVTDHGLKPVASDEGGFRGS